MEDKDSDALAVFRKNFDNSDEPINGLGAALTADRMGNTELRDRLLAQVRERSAHFVVPTTGRVRQSLVDLAGLFADDLKRGGHATFDLGKVEEICKREDGVLPHTAACFVGEYLSRHGKLADAQRFWLHAMDETGLGVLYFELAAYRLKQSGVDPADQAELRKKLGIKERWSFTFK